MKKYLCIMLVIIMSFSVVACGNNPNTDTSSVDDTVSTATTVTEPEGFDANDIILRLAVISDLHLSYSYMTGEEVLKNCDGYADAMADLCYLSGGNLDAVLMCGDYTNLGLELQARTFAGATKTIVDSVFGDRPPKLVIGMGNHDTCWGRNTAAPCMNDAAWYRLLGEYGLNAALEPDSDTEHGNLHVSVKAGDKTYHILYVETDMYAENAFLPSTLTWLRTLLKQFTEENPDQFVFVGTHGQVAETGNYGTDAELEGGAVWACARNNIDTVLRNYPQVVLFTGHSHFSEYLETAIMQRNYTSLNVSPVLSQSMYNGTYTKCIDSPYLDRRGGMGYYIEIDGKGAMRIQRVDFSLSDDTATVTGTYEKHLSPAFGVQKNEQEDLYTVTLSSCTLTGNKNVSVYGTPWVIKTPDTNKEFLKRYSDARGEADAPSFPKGSKLTVSESKANTCTVYFPAAESKSGNKILWYWITVRDEQGEPLLETRAIGNWADTKSGVATGNTHVDATAFLYKIDGFSSNGTYSVTVSPVDEYGNRGNMISAFVAP